MDERALMNTLLSSQSISGIGKAAGTSKINVQSVLANAVPFLLQGASNQANNASTAEGFAQALNDHAQEDTSNITSFMKDIDIKDGAKIISHLLNSASTNSIVNQSGVAKGTTQDILSAVAPLFMSLLGQQSSGTSTNALGSVIGSLTQNANVTSLIGSLLGSSSGSSSNKPQSNQSSSGKKTGGLLSGLMSLLK